MLSLALVLHEIPRHFWATHAFGFEITRYVHIKTDLAVWFSWQSIGYPSEVADFIPTAVHDQVNFSAFSELMYTLRAQSTSTTGYANQELNYHIDTDWSRVARSLHF